MMPARSTLRRNPQLPMRTRSGRGPKSASKSDKPEVVSPKSSFSHSSNTPLTRKTTRSAYSFTNYAGMDAGPNIQTSYEDSIFIIFGLPPEFLSSLEERGPNDRTEPPTTSALFDDSETEEDSSTEESDEPTSSHPAPTRGRGRGRGGRGRGRGGGRGRGSRGGRGRGRGGRAMSPLRSRPSRNAAPMFPLTEEDDEEPSNQSSSSDAKESPDPEEDGIPADEDFDKYEDSDDDMSMEEIRSDSFNARTPPGSPPAELVEAYNDPLKKIPVPVAVPKISLPAGSASGTPLGGSTPVESAVPRLIDPEDDELSDSDLPEPWIEGLPPPIEAECEDRADYLLKKRFKAMPDVQDIIASLTKYSFSQRSTESLYALAENTQRILQAWQDEYLMLDARTGPLSHPPKKPCNGGRIPMNPVTFEEMKEADLYGYTYDPKKAPGMQDPFTQRPGHERSRGRELRTRRARDMLDSAVPSEEEEEAEEGRPAKRQRRATRKFDISTGTSSPKKHSGWGGARKKGVSKYAQPAVPQTPELDARGKRGKVSTALLHQRIQEMREESAVTSSGDEGSSNGQTIDDDEQQTTHQKRGRPMGSKNVGRRSDYGVKKGPRKRIIEEDVSVPSSSAPETPPLLQSLSEGQNQFTVDPPLGSNNQPVVGPHSTESVFQATPQPPGASEASSYGQSPQAHTPDTYMKTTPLSQYSNPYVDDMVGVHEPGSRKKPRVKSEKRSQSMTIWWAERKARQKEMDEKNGVPPKTTTPRLNSSTGRRGGKAPTAREVPKSTPEPYSRPTTSYVEPAPQPLSQDPYASQPLPQDSYAPQPLPQDPYASHHQLPPPPPFSAPSPSDAYSPGTYPPPPPIMMQSSPLTALPSGPSPGPPTSGPPNSHPGPGRALAPAPLPPPVPAAYPGPYGPRSAPRPKSNVPPPLAPAPPHVSPYPPISSGPAQPREIPFKIMVPGLPPSEQGRDSR